MMNAADLANHLDGRQYGDGWRARCPVHAGKSDNSLSISESEGRVLLHCFSGCATEDIVATIGLKLSDLFIDSNLTKSGRKLHAAVQNHHEIESALSHELLVLSEIVGTRVAERKLSKDSKFRELRPEWRPMPYEHWDREIEAATRIRKALGALYDL